MIKVRRVDGVIIFLDQQSERYRDVDRRLASCTYRKNGVSVIHSRMDHLHTDRLVPIETDVPSILPRQTTSWMSYRHPLIDIHL